MSWGADEPQRTPGWPPSTKYRKPTADRVSGPPLEVLPGEDTPLTSGRRGLPVPRPPTPAGWGFKEAPITLGTGFNICKTATRAAKVNSVPGSSKVSGF